MVEIGFERRNHGKTRLQNELGDAGISTLLGRLCLTIADPFRLRRRITGNVRVICYSLENGHLKIPFDPPRYSYPANKYTRQTSAGMARPVTAFALPRVSYHLSGYCRIYRQLPHSSIHHAPLSPKGEHDHAIMLGMENVRHNTNTNDHRDEIRLDYLAEGYKNPLITVYYHR